MTNMKLFRPHKVAASIARGRPTEVSVESVRRRGTFWVIVIDRDDGGEAWSHDTGLTTDDVADVLASLLAEELCELGVQADVL